MPSTAIRAVLATVLGLFLAACAPAKPPPIALSDTSWLLATLNGQPLAAGALVTLNFGKDQITGSDGCNSYTAAYTLNGAKITVAQNIATTKRACAEPVMGQAAAYVAALRQAVTYAGNGQRLTLLDAGGKTLATFTAQSSSLGGTSWVLSGINNGQQAVVSTLGGTTLTAVFSADGTLGGLSGCNSYGTTYQVSGTSIEIGLVVSTEKACAGPAGIMEQETQFLKALESVASYRLDGNHLELRTAGGALAMTLERAR